jgi:alkanesulfonate monooxygenase SsuD/methylene tetrahydromethanopterin reductase-like flavin-dependent oxidoreductase (luciferase family)
VRFGLHTGQHQVRFADLVELWRDAERWGFDACYLFDHFVPLHSGVEGFLPEEADHPTGPCLEATTALAALARAVPRIGVGLMVASVGYRAPGLLAHAAATVAQAAGPGRMELGIGAGWFEPSYRAAGLPMPPPAERFDELERALQALASWLRGESASIPGIAEQAPPPPFQPAPRVWIAGTGERRLLPLAARHADSWNAMYLTPVGFKDKVDALSERCESIGRNPSTLERSIALRAFCSENGAAAFGSLAAWAAARSRDPERLRARSLVGTPEDCRRQLERYAEAGATHLAVMAHPPYDREGLALLAGEVFPAFR